MITFMRAGEVVESGPASSVLVELQHPDTNRLSEAVASAGPVGRLR